MRLKIILIGFALLTSCASPEDTVYPDSAYGPPPANWRTVTVEYVKSQLKDPYSARIRLAETGPRKIPVRVLGGAGKTVPGYQVDIYVNAKNSFGAYIGETLVPVYFVNGRPYYALL